MKKAFIVMLSVFIAVAFMVPHAAAKDPVKIGVRGRGLDGTISGWGYEPAMADGDVSYRLEARFNPDPEMRLRAGEPLVIRLPDE